MYTVAIIKRQLDYIETRTRMKVFDVTEEKRIGRNGRVDNYP